MKLLLHINPQQEASLHWTASDALHFAAFADNLDHAEARLRAMLNPAAWGIYRGGHHIAVHWESGAQRTLDGVRVAIITEANHVA